MTDTSIQKGDWVIVHEPSSKENYPYDWYSPDNHKWGMDSFIGKLGKVTSVVNSRSVSIELLPIYGAPKPVFYTFQTYHLEKAEKTSEEA